ncbi:MAG TPA: hypothetical protein VFS43_31145 [Polyangiaceae bacterium]|nr:hypothetical protein [Polyangiaceae bacterium]
MPGRSRQGWYKPPPAVPAAPEVLGAPPGTPRCVSNTSAYSRS